MLLRWKSLRLHKLVVGPPVVMDGKYGVVRTSSTYLPLHASALSPPIPQCIASLRLQQTTTYGSGHQNEHLISHIMCAFGTGDLVTMVQNHEFEFAMSSVTLI